MENNQNKVRLFGMTVASVENATSVFILTFIILLFGMRAYTGMPKEAFPEIVIPTITVQSIYPGNSPVDMENLVARHIDKQMKSLMGVKSFKTTCLQDVAVTIVEFNTDVKVDKALVDVKDAVDKAKTDLPKDNNFLEPVIKEINFQDIPFMSVLVSGNFNADQLRQYGEYFQDEIEKLPEVSEVILKGVMDREVKIDLDLAKMSSMMLSFNDVAYAVQGENLTMSGGDLQTNGIRRGVRIMGEFKNVQEINDLVVKSENGNTIYMRDIVSKPVRLEYEDPTSFARMDGNPVVSLDVKKRSGKNLIDAADKIKLLIKKAKETKAVPAELKILIFNDQSNDIRDSVSNLENSIISGVILVVLILLFFLGVRNASIVGLAIPLSMLLGFLTLSIMGMKLNTVVLFALILALGMLVDNAIVVVENCFRFVKEGHSKLEAAKLGTSEVAIPIISSTATTVAAFLPMVAWPGIMGEFMKYLPITLSITLLASLFVALVINPVFIGKFMDMEESENMQLYPARRRNTLIAIGAMAVLALVGLVTGVVWLRNLSAIMALLSALSFFVLRPAAFRFQASFLPWLETKYQNFINWSINRPWSVFIGSFVLMFLGIFFMIARAPKVVFFPTGDPKYVNVFVEMPIGTDIKVTDKLTREIEGKVIKAIQPYRSIVDAVLGQVGKDTGDPSGPPAPSTSSGNMARITVNFVLASQRKGMSSADCMEAIREAVKGYAGVSLVVDKNSDGPPAGKPINIEITGNDQSSVEDLLKASEEAKKFLNAQNIAGIEALQSDVKGGKPELVFSINRESIRRFGASTSDAAMAIRTALFGSEVSKLKDQEDDYKIFVRLDEGRRYDIDQLLAMNITFRNPANGRMVQLPMSAVADVKYTSTYTSVSRKDGRRTITVYSNILKEYNANEVVAKTKSAMLGCKLPDGFGYEFTGEQEAQEESMAFLGSAFLVALFAIFLIIVAQFNSLMSPVVIMFSIIFSTIGVFLGYALTGADLVIIMFGVGIISLAGVVVNNAIVLIDYAQLLVQNKKYELGLGEDDYLEEKDVKQALVVAGSTRLRPVLLTAITTILGLIPLAIGLNINFITLVTESDPQFFIGGDSVAFWGPLSWTTIYGLSFSTLLTLVVVPVMYLLMVYRGPKWLDKLMK